MSKKMHVIIIGGGVAGLAAAAAVSEFCDLVTIVEKDAAPTKKSPRRYAPQGAHIHILLQAGLNILEKFLPGIQQELIEGGSVQINAGEGQQVFEYGAWRPSRFLDMSYLGQSRMHLESTLYRRVSMLANVSYIRNTVEALELTGDNHVAGVNLSKPKQTILADMVLDASGVAGVFSNWLRRANIASVDVESFPIHIFYSTIHFKKPKEYKELKENILIVPEAGVSNYGGSLIDIEDDTWCVSLHGRDGESVPKNLEAWLEAIRSLPDIRIWERIVGAEAVSEVAHFKKSNAIWRRFDTCDDLPRGYIPLGDAINSLNPIFGQGMTVAVGHVEALYKVALKHGLRSNEDFSKEFFDMAMEWTAKVWKKSKAFDKNFFSETRENKKRIELIRKLTAAQHEKMSESDDFLLRVIKESQMLI